MSIRGPADLLPGSEQTSTCLVQFCDWSSATVTNVSATTKYTNWEKKWQVYILWFYHRRLRLRGEKSFLRFCPFPNETGLNPLPPTLTLISHILLLRPEGQICRFVDKRVFLCGHNHSFNKNQSWRGKMKPDPEHCRSVSFHFISLHVFYEDCRKVTYILVKAALLRGYLYQVSGKEDKGGGGNKSIEELIKKKKKKD